VEHVPRNVFVHGRLVDAAGRGLLDRQIVGDLLRDARHVHDANVLDDEHAQPPAQRLALRQ
jgi:hypothetical protein